MTTAAINEQPPVGQDGPSKPRQRLKLRWAGWGWIGLVLLLVPYIAVLHTRYAPAISGPDDNGYFAQGSLIAQTARTWFAPSSDSQYVGYHWLLTASHTFISRYPPGLPVLIAAVYKTAGWKATFLINPALSVLVLVGIFLVARQIVSTWWALVAAALLATTPMFLLHALSGWSHMAAAALLTWGIYLLVRWGDEGRLWLALAAGLMLGCIPPVRCADAVVGGGAGIYLLWHWRRFPAIWRHYLAAITGAALPIVPFLIHNHLLLGAFWRTGYSLTNEETGFSRDNFVQHGIDYLRQMNGDGVGMLFALGVVGMICMIFKKGDKRTRPAGIMLLMMSAAMLLLYMAYYWDPQTQWGMLTLRFLLPTYPIFILAGVWLGREVSSGSVTGTIVLGAALVGFQILWGWNQLRDEGDRLQYRNRSLALITESLEQVAQPGDVVLAHGVVLQQLDFVRKWRLADYELMRNQDDLPGADDDPKAPKPSQDAKQKWLNEKYRGDSRVRSKKFLADVFAWAGEAHKIYLIGTTKDFEGWNGIRGARVNIVRRISLPASPKGNDGGRDDKLAGLFAPGGLLDRAAGMPGQLSSFGGEKEYAIAEFIPPPRDQGGSK